MFSVAVLDGKVIHLDTLKLSDFFAGFFFGAGLFETMRIVAQRPQFLGRHVERLKRGLSAISAIEAPAVSRLSVDILGADITAGIARCVAESATIPDIAKVTVSDGHVLVTFRESSPAEAMCIDVLEDSYRAGDTLLNHKTIAYLKQYRRLRSDLLFQNERGELCETPTANVFVVFEDHVATPPLSAPCLAGIIREVLLERGRLGDLRLIEEPIPASSMAATIGVWVTNSIALARPVTSYLGRALPGSVAFAARAREAVSFHESGGAP
jgi:branched-chain amino acid aminotransferase